MIRFIFLVLALLVVVMCITEPNEKDIAQCVENSNYTEKQCRFELSL